MGKFVSEIVHRDVFTSKNGQVLLGLEGKSENCYIVTMAYIFWKKLERKGCTCVNDEEKEEEEGEEEEEEEEEG